VTATAAGFTARRFADNKNAPVARGVFRCRRAIQTCTISHSLISGGTSSVAVSSSVGCSQSPREMWSAATSGHENAPSRALPNVASQPPLPGRCSTSRALNQSEIPSFPFSLSDYKRFCGAARRLGFVSTVVAKRRCMEASLRPWPQPMVRVERFLETKIPF
jgi:hypothetical protein